MGRRGGKRRRRQGRGEKTVGEGLLLGGAPSHNLTLPPRCNPFIPQVPPSLSLSFSVSLSDRLLTNMSAEDPRANAGQQVTLKYGILSTQGLGRVEGNLSLSLFLTRFVFLIYSVFHPCSLFSLSFLSLFSLYLCSLFLLDRAEGVWGGVGG